MFGMSIVCPEHEVDMPCIQNLQHDSYIYFTFICFCIFELAIMFSLYILHLTDFNDRLATMFWRVAKIGSLTTFEIAN